MNATNESTMGWKGLRSLMETPEANFQSSRKRSYETEIVLQHGLTDNGRQLDSVSGKGRQSQSKET